MSAANRGSLKPKTWIARVFAEDDGERRLLGEAEVVAVDRANARRLAMDQLWDDRLDAAGCLARVELEAASERH